MPQRRFVDFHTHSTASDGAFRPVEVVAAADAANLAALALTDHDTVAGLPEAQAAAASYPLLRLVPGIEISAKFPHGTLHMVGLGVDPASPALADLTAQLQDARAQRNPNMLAKLADLGMPLTMDEVVAVAAPAPATAGRPRVLGRVHIAQAMIRKGYVATLTEAFDKYLSTGRPAYVDKERLTPRQAIDAIHAASGLAVLAHPPQLHCTNFAQLETVVRDLVAVGLDGIEAYHAENSDLMVRFCLDLAHRLNLGLSGGSDFHGNPRLHYPLGRPRIPLAALTEKFLAKLLG